MKENWRLAAVAVKNSIKLNGVALGVGIKTFENWKGCLELDETVLSGLLKYTVEDAKVFLYKMGAIVTAGLDENQERDILGKLEGFLEIDYLNHMYLLSEYDWCSISEVYTKAEAMARSIRLKWIEMQVNDLMEETEPLLIKMGKGSKRGFSPKLRHLVAKIQRFEIETVGILAMLGRPYQGRSKEYFEQYVENYAIKERLLVVIEKLDILKEITTAHELFGRFVGWQRLLVIEVILLVCFPIPGIMTLNLFGLWKNLWSFIQLLVK